MYIYIYSIYIIPIFPSYSKHVNHLQFYRFTIGYTPTELLGTGTGSANHQVMLVDIDGFYMAPLNGHGDWLPDFDALGRYYIVLFEPPAFYVVKCGTSPVGYKLVMFVVTLLKRVRFFNACCFDATNINRFMMQGMFQTVCFILADGDASEKALCELNVAMENPHF